MPDAEVEDEATNLGVPKGNGFGDPAPAVELVTLLALYCCCLKSIHYLQNIMYRRSVDMAEMGYRWERNGSPIPPLAMPKYTLMDFIFALEQRIDCRLQKMLFWFLH